MSLTGPPVYYFLSLSSVSVLNMEGGAGTCLKGKGGGVMLGDPKVLVCDARASGPQPTLTAEASGQSQRGFCVFQPSASLCVVSVCENVFLWDH